MKLFRPHLAAMALVLSLPALPQGTTSPLIQGTTIDYSKTPPQMTILGVNFGTGTPSVLLNPNTNLTVLPGSTSSSVTAQLPANLAPGSYLITLTTAQGNKSESFFPTIGTVGPQGPVGPAGAVGPQGAAGPMGPVGLPGATGAPGPIGPVGPVGPAGSTGAVGPAGPAGPIGPSGMQGPAGNPGAPGPIGPVGPAGPAGQGGGVRVIDSAGHSYPYDVALNGSVIWQSQALGGKTFAIPVNQNGMGTAFDIAFLVMYRSSDCSGTSYTQGTKVPFLHEPFSFVAGNTLYYVSGQAQSGDFYSYQAHHSNGNTDSCTVVTGGGGATELLPISTFDLSADFVPPFHLQVQ
jgi:Collagen triple helix repeat (20 copies)